MPTYAADDTSERQVITAFAVEIAKADLLALDKSVDYARNQLETNPGASVLSNAEINRIQEKSKTAYREFLRVAWGKSVEIETAKSKKFKFRLSQAAAVFAEPNLNIATPNSPMGKIIATARIGDDGENTHLGEFTITGVGYYLRYPQSEETEKNFAKIQWTGVENFSLNNLASATSNERIEEAEKKDEKTGAESDAPPVQVPGQPRRGNLTLTPPKRQPSISSLFYVNTTKEQWEAIHSNYRGLVLVEGVAGSGKTAVALGRSKSLSQLQQAHNRNIEFEDFSAEKQIGVVRTKELVAYLKMTAHALELEKLRIVEFDQILVNCIEHWRIPVIPNQLTEDTWAKIGMLRSEKGSSEWMDSVSRQMLHMFCQNFKMPVGENSKVETPREMTTTERNIIKKVSDKIIGFIQDADTRFFFKKLTEYVDQQLREIFERQLWIGIPSAATMLWHIDDRAAAFNDIKNSRNPLCAGRDIYNRYFIIPEGDAPSTDQLPEGIISRNAAGDIKQITIPSGESGTYVASVVYLSKAEYELKIINGEAGFYDGVTTIERPIQNTNGQEGRSEKISRIKIKPILAMRNGKRIQPADASDPKLENLYATLKSRVISNFRRKLSDFSPERLFASLDPSQKQSTSIENMGREDIEFLVAFCAEVFMGLSTDLLPSKSDRIKNTPSYSSIFIDEYQDFTEVQLRLLAALSDPKYFSVTVSGDSAQCLSGEPPNVSACFPERMFKSRKAKFTENIRQAASPSLSATSGNFRSHFLDSEIKQPQTDTFNDGTVTYFESNDGPETLDAVSLALEQATLERPVVAIFPDSEIAERFAETLEIRNPTLRGRIRRDKIIDTFRPWEILFTSPKQSKGLEFERVILCGIEEYNFNHPSSLSRLYVSITRATHSLCIISNFKAIKKSVRKILLRHAKPVITGN